MSGFDLPVVGQQLWARLDAMARRGGSLGEVTDTAKPAVESFNGVLTDAIAKVDGLTKRVGDQVGELASGEPVALHDIMISMGKSEVAFNLMLEVRNKLVDAFEKLSRSVV